MTMVDPTAAAPSPGEGLLPDPTRFHGCPYLISADGGWRTTTSAREHRCWAVAPPAPLATEKQRRLCLTSDHVGCATFEAAEAARTASHEREPVPTRPVARTTPVILDHGRLSLAVPALRMDRRSGQTILIGLLSIAFAALILGRLTGGGVSGPSDRPDVSASVAPASSPQASIGTPAPTFDAGGTGSPAPVASDPAAPTPPVSGSRTYRVKSGDTLIAIATRFETTPRKLRKLNGLEAGSTLKVGQVLQIP